MKKQVVILLAMLVTFVAGCSKITHSPETDGNDWVHDMSLPVPVEISLLPGTKAPIWNVSDMVGSSFGVYAVSSDSQYTVAENVCQNLSNRMVTCVETEERISLDFSPAAYYPADSDYYYKFYGYHPYTSDGYETADKVLVPVDLGGDDDILYAKSTSGLLNGEVTDGFNAEYIRNGGMHPSFRFEHVTSGLRFRIRNTLDNGITFSVRSLLFVDFPVEAELCLVDRGEDEGKLLNAVYGNFYLGGSENLNVPVVGNVPSTLADEIFVMPQESFVCRLEIEVNDGVETRYVSSDFVLRPGDFQYGLSGHEAGYIYKYMFVIGKNGEDIIVRIEKDTDE